MSILLWTLHTHTPLTLSSTLSSRLRAQCGVIASALNDAHLRRWMVAVVMMMMLR